MQEAMAGAGDDDAGAAAVAVPTGPVKSWITAASDDPSSDPVIVRRLTSEVQDALALCAKLDVDAGQLLAGVAPSDL